MNERDEHVSLKEWTQGLNEATRDRIVALESHIEQLFESSQRAVDIAAEAMTIRLDHANGLIKQMKDQTADFASRVELGAVDRRLALIEQKRANLEGSQMGAKPIRDLAMVLVGALLTYIATKLLT